MHGTIFSVQTPQTKAAGSGPAIHVKENWIGHRGARGNPITHAEYAEELKMLIDESARRGDMLNAKSLQIILKTLPSESDCAVCKSVRVSKHIIDEFRKR